MKELTAFKIPVKDIDTGDRVREQYAELDELAQSIRQHGLFNPVTLADKTKIEDWKGINTDSLSEEKPYLLLAGGRRFHSFRKAEISDTIDARVYDHILTDEEIKTIELEENLRRVDLTWSEEVKLKKQIHEIQQRIHGKAVRGGGANKGKGHSIKDTADMLEVDESTVIKDIKLANALDKMPELATAKNKTEARKMLKHLSKDINSTKKAKLVEQQRATTPLDKQRKQLYDSYILKDFFEGIRSIEKETIDVVELDPPYAINLTKEKKSSKHITQDYNEIDVDDFMEFMTNVLNECYRVMKKNSWLIMWFGPDPWFEPMLTLMREIGFDVRGLPGIWSKGRGQTQRPELYLANSYEMFFYARKGNPGIRKQGRANVFGFPPVSSQKKTHPTERPVELIEEVLRVFGEPGNRVLVPFLGSGNTLLSASNIGMKAFGYEISDIYRDRFVEKVSESQPGAYKSYGG